MYYKFGNFILSGIFTQMSYAAGGAALGGVVAGPAGAMVGGIVGKKKDLGFIEITAWQKYILSIDVVFSSSGTGCPERYFA